MFKHRDRGQFFTGVDLNLISGFYCIVKFVLHAVDHRDLHDDSRRDEHGVGLVHNKAKRRGAVEFKLVEPVHLHDGAALSARKDENLILDAHALERVADFGHDAGLRVSVVKKDLVGAGEHLASHLARGDLATGKCLFHQHTLPCFAQWMQVAVSRTAMRMPAVSM